VLVYVELGGDDVLAGQLFSHRRRGSESASFRYDNGYLARPDAYALDPQLTLVSGTQQTEVGLKLFRAFADSAPDRWGRNLFLRRERLRAREFTSTMRSFAEFDFLLAVRDDLRQGSLRFRSPDDGVFLASEATGVPLLTDLPTLLGAAERLDRDSAGYADLQTLVRAGSSLGGARPKAHLRDPDSGALAIAKFPRSASDRWNVMAWEKTALDLARACGIDTPKNQLISVDGRDVLVVERFDRRDERRIGYTSALTWLEATDGEQRTYLEIASVVEERSPSPTTDLAQLWRRLVFNILISNSDDHLRNHGFLHAGGDAWRLSPAFDLNPNPDPGPKQLSTAIDSGDPAARIDTALSVAALFRLDPAEARHILSDVATVCSSWRVTARRNGLAGAQLDAMAPAFEHDQADQARRVIHGDTDAP